MIFQFLEKQLLVFTQYSGSTKNSLKFKHKKMYWFSFFFQIHEKAYVKSFRNYCSNVSFSQIESYTYQVERLWKTLLIKKIVAVMFKTYCTGLIDNFLTSSISLIVTFTATMHLSITICQNIFVKF